MSRQSNGVDLSLLAAADYSGAGNQYRAVDVDSNGKAVKASAAGQSASVSCRTSPAPVRLQPSVWRRLEGGSRRAVTAGALLKCDAQGRVVAASAGVTNTSDAGAASDPLIGSFVIGRALAAAGAAGEIIPVLVEPQGAVPTTAA
jgi:hypothetical protein